MVTEFLKTRSAAQAAKGNGVSIQKRTRVGIWSSINQAMQSLRIEDTSWLIRVLGSVK